MTIMYEHIAAQCNCCIIIDTASAVGDISHDYSQRISKTTLQTISLRSLGIENVFCAPLNYICDSANKHLEALGHLESNHSGIVLTNVMYSFMDLK
jgi:hypothetical protein